MKKLMLIDGMAMVYRAYFALNRSPRLNSKGQNTSAALGFTTTLYDLMRKQQPTHMAVAFDLSTPTFRHTTYEAYKANREPMPEDIASMLPYIHRLLDAFHIPVLTCEGYEADDVVGSASLWAEQHGFDDVLMVTPDKDFAQLVTAKTHLYRFGRGGKPDEIYGEKEVCEHFGVSRPRQVIDLLGLWGDSIDNIPGIPGVGEKKAKQLIEQFGSIENMVKNSDEIRNEKLRQCVQQHADQALLSKQLATIALDAPVAFDESSMLMQQPDYNALRTLFDELEFRTFAKRFFTDLSVTQPDVAIQHMAPAKPVPTTPQKAKPKTSEPDPAQPTLFDLIDAGESKKNDIIPMGKLPQQGNVGIIINGPEIAISTSADDVFMSTVDRIDLAQLKHLLEDKETLKLCHDLKALKYILRELDIELAGNIFDIQLAHYLVDPEMRHTLAFISQANLGYEPTDTAGEASVLWSLYPLLVSQMADAHLEKLYTDIELPLVDVLISMEQEGVRIDVDSLRQYSAELTQQRQTIEQQIYHLAGITFNISSPKQLGEVLYERMEIVDKPPRTATKQYSTAEDVLDKLRDKHPIVDLILQYRSISKLVGTYLDSFPKLINPATGRLHTYYNQTVTATGRLSSSHPNLQNIPIRTDMGRPIRKAFVARNDDYILMAADYSQIELRIIAALANDRHMIEAFANHYDIHAATAARIYGLDIEQVSKDQRRNAKSVNFGIVYGISAFGLAEQLNISRKEAAQLIDEYFHHYPDIKRFIDISIARAHQQGYAQTLLGRRRYLYDINSRNGNLRSFAERNAVNMPIQGTSADMIKIAMNRIFARFNEEHMQSKMILQIHDELVFDVYRPEEEQVRQIVEHEMLHAIELPIPIEVSIDVGDNWLDAH